MIEQNFRVAVGGAELIGHVLQPQLIIDGPGRGHHHSQGVHIGGAVIAAQVEHTGHLAFGGKNRRGGADQEVVGLAVVLGGEDLHRLALEDGGADGVGALRRLTPVSARTQLILAGAGGDLGVADDVEKVAGFVAQHNLESGAFDELVEPFHHRPGDLDEGTVLMQPLFEFAAVNLAVGRAQGIDVQVLATLPGTGNLRAQVADVKRRARSVLLPRALNNEIILSRKHTHPNLSGLYYQPRFKIV